MSVIDYIHRAVELLPKKRPDNILHRLLRVVDPKEVERIYPRGH